MTSAVPRSGWAAMSRTAQPPGRKTGRATRRSVGAPRRAPDSTAEACSTSASFITSAAWNWSGPAPSQRRAPLTLTPIPGIEDEHEHHERGHEQQRRVAPDARQVVPGAEVHHDQPERRRT